MQSNAEPNSNWGLAGIALALAFVFVTVVAAVNVVKAVKGRGVAASASHQLV